MENNTVPATGKRIALITGASSGMGREFVLALDRQEKFDELWLVARLIFAYWLTPAASGVSALLPLCRWMTS